jgi:hypothetical protein
VLREYAGLITVKPSVFCVCVSDLIQKLDMPTTKGFAMGSGDLSRWKAGKRCRAKEVKILFG